MASRTDRIIDEMLADWAMEGQRVTVDIRQRFHKLALLAERVIEAGGQPEILKAYHDTVKLEMASGALAAERGAREAFQRTAVRAIRYIVLAVGA
jgi:hypothetical protein